MTEHPVAGLPPSDADAVPQLPARAQSPDGTHVDGASMDPLRRLAMHAAGTGAWYWQPDSGNCWVDPDFAAQLGYPAHGPTPQPDGRLLGVAHPEDAASLEAWYRCLETGVDAADEIQFRIVDAQGNPHWMATRGQAVTRDAEGTARLVCGLHTEISRRRQAEADILQLAYFDTLTGLANRTMLQEKLSQMIAVASRARQRLAVLFVDLDKFKVVNDTLGHEAGDLLLRQVAERLRAQVRDGDVVARIGGDEFVIVLSQVTQDDQPARAARRLIDALADPVLVFGHEAHVSPSIGISVFPDDGRDVATLLKNADTAMYRVKEQGRNSYRFYTAAMNEAVVSEARIEQRLRRAFAAEALTVHFQPVVDAHTRKPVGAEALLRWEDEELGVVPPLRFLPVADRALLTGPLCAWTLGRVCRLLQQARDEGRRPVPVAVNVSASQFNDPDLLSRVRGVLRESGLEDPSLVSLEFAETTLMKDPEQAAAVLGILKSLGLRLTIDDFGMGGSSLAYLRRFPVDRIKIDRSFVSSIPDNPESLDVTAAIVDVARRMRLRTGAEGVETEIQAAYLRRIGCDDLQGFYFGLPGPKLVTAA